MSPILRSSCVVLLACFLLSTVCAHNITQILEKEPKFSTFNQLLTETGLAKEINGRKTITVLAIPNDQIGSLSGKPLDVVKNILKTHIVLDYYDLLKLGNMKGKSTTMTTLFQSTGVAHYSQGFLNATQTSDGVMFGSAVKDAQRDAKLAGSVAALPYNISVLSISQPINTPGMDATDLLRPVSAPPPKVAKAPAPGKKEKDTPAESPEEPETPPPAEAPAPSDEAKTPAAAPPKPDADADAADKAAPPKSSAGKLFVSTLGLAVVLASCLAFL